MLQIVRRRLHVVGGGGGLIVPAPSFHMAELLQMAGDRVVSCPDGTYDTAAIDWAASAHASTAGPYGGWLILQAQNASGAVIDGGTNGFQLGTSGVAPKNMRIMLVGFKQLNTTFQSYNSSYLRWWYPEFTFPATAWKTAYIAAGGNPNASPDNTYRFASGNWTCAGIRCLGDVNPYVTNLGVYGGWFHNIGDDGIFLQGASNGEIKGCTFVDVHHHDQFNPRSSEYFHADVLQSEWGSNWSVTDNHFGGHIQMDAHFSNLTNWVFNNNWHSGSPDLGFTYDTAPSGTQRDITGSSVSNSQWWHNGQYYGYSANPTYWSDYDVFQYGFGNAPTGLTFNSITNATPAGVPVAANLITDLPDQPSAVGHALNPAKIWRTANPYASWATYFAGNWP